MQQSLHTLVIHCIALLLEPGLVRSLALAMPRVDEIFLAGFAQGLWSLADAHGIELVGGDTTAGPLNICLTVLGQVAQPGRYTFPRGVPPQLPIEEAIALAGGCTRLARQSHVLVKRGSAVYQVNLDKLASQPNQPPAIIVAGDVITVAERKF